MLHYLHQQVTNIICLSFGAEQEVFWEAFPCNERFVNINVHCDGDGYHRK